jgi:phosphate starvation-inducible protein PhoH
MESIDLENLELTRELFGQHNNNLDKICDAFQVTINTRGTSLLIDGSAFDVNLAQTLIKKLYVLLQDNLPTGKKSGLIEAKKILTNIKGIKFIYFSKNDVVRHKLVSDIIDAYEKKQNRK